MWALLGDLCTRCMWLYSILMYDNDYIKQNKTNRTREGNFTRLHIITTT